MSSVIEYNKLLDEYCAKRDAGELTTEEEDKYLDALDKLWYSLSEEEVEEFEPVNDAIQDVIFAKDKLDALISGKCKYCSKHVPVGDNTCAGCSDEHGP